MNSKFSFVVAGLGLVSLCLGGSVSAVEIIAHRGASHDAPENSLSAMNLAWTQNADGIETDIYLSKDYEIVVMHDKTTKRTGDRDKIISECTWRALKDIDIGKWKGEQWTGETIPTLDSILATIPKSNKSIFTEIKIQDQRILSRLEKAMADSGRKPSQLRIITFHYDMAQAAKAYFPKHPVYWLHDYKQDKETKEYPKLEDLIAKAKEARLDGLDLNFKFPIDKEFVKAVHKAGLKLYTWTVDEPEVARAHVKAGVDGITTNRPQFLRDAINEKQQKTAAK
jgi:glycerophosphoryl diester phosphodiesterase